MLENQIQTLNDIYRRTIPDGVSFSKFKADCLRDCLPPVGSTDYDIGCPCPENLTPAPPGVDGLAWLVGGNYSDQLTPDIPPDGGYDLGINVSDPELPASSAKLHIITSGTNRIEIFGNAADEPDEYRPGMEGRVVIANGFIENRDIPAVFAPLLPPSTPPSPPSSDGDVLPPMADVYLERPSNAYNLVVPEDFGTLITTDDNAAVSAIFNNAYTLAAETVRIVFINNIFLGEKPYAVDITYDTNYNPDQVAPTDNTSFGLGIHTFDYLLKIFNPSDATPIAVMFNIGEAAPISPTGGGPSIPNDSRITPIYSTVGMGTSTLSYIIPVGGAGFFNMRVEEGKTHIMLDNVVYPDYMEPSPP